MDPSESDDLSRTATQSAPPSPDHDPHALVEEYRYLLDEATHIEDMPKEPHAMVVELLDVVTNAYALPIVGQLVCEERPLRFSELEDALGVSPKVLSQRLKELAGIGLVSRESYDEIPPRVEYESTVKAEELGPAFQFLYAWAERYDSDETDQENTLDPWVSPLDM